MWTFIHTDSRFGEKGIVSPNFNETYIVKPTGTWVPEMDANYLLTIRWPCACDGGVRQVFHKGNPTARHMKLRPTREPRGEI